MEFVRLKPINRICPHCGDGNYMRIIEGKNVGELNVKCINCNSYYNYNKLCNGDNYKLLNGTGGQTMADLISRAAALDVLVTSPNFHTTLTRIEELPAVDAVPVIRCRDCKHSIENAKHIDVACERSYNPGFYCAAGEREG